MELTAKQADVKAKIEFFARLLEIPSDWACAIAEVESNYGLYQKSKTAARGVFQMTGIAMKDLLLEMEKHDDDTGDIVIGILFLRLLLRRHKNIRRATEKYCDPNDRDFYIDKVFKIMGGEV